MNNKVIIRADAGGEIGWGHMVRCIALAHMLTCDFEVDFAALTIPEHLILSIQEQGFRLMRLAEEDSFFELITPGSVVVLDGYHFDTAYQEKVKQKQARLVCIDDLHDKQFVADLIINHAPGVSTEEYNALPHTKFALGPGYALLRPAFLQYRASDKIFHTSGLHVLICFGGSDERNLTEDIYKMVEREERMVRIHIVTGTSYRYDESLEKATRADNRVMHHKGIPEEQMFELMNSTDVAIVPSSGVLFEVLATGNIAVSGFYVENQKDIYKGFLSQGMIIDGGDFSEAFFRHNAVFEQVYKKIAVHPQPMIDGNSGKRILEIFKNL